MNLTLEIKRLSDKYEKDRNSFKEIADTFSYFQALKDLGIEVTI